MRRSLLLALLLFASVASAQITVTANVPPFGFQVPPGSTRQINAQIVNAGTTPNPCGPTTSPSCAGTVVWTGTGGITFTNPTNTAVSSLTGLATVQVNIGNTAGTCTISGSAYPYTITGCTAVETATATSTDDATKHATFTFNVVGPPTCTSNLLGNGAPCVPIAPFYQQVYAGKPATLQSWVTGFVNENVVWSIHSQPGGGNGALADTTNRDTIFTATVAGEYVIYATSVADGSRVGSAIVYVSSDSVPSYASTPNGTVPVPCDNDPTAFTTDYEVGSGQAYTTISSTPAFASIAAGTIYRIHPGTYAEYMSVEISGTPEHPVMVCGVPDGSGNLPTLNAQNAVSQSTVVDYGFGLIVLAAPSHYGLWQGGSSLSNIVISGLHLENAGGSSTFVPPGGSGYCPPNYTTPGQTSCPWVASAPGGVAVEAGQNVAIIGIDSDTNANGIFTNDNGANFWATITANIAVIGNHFHGSGVNGNAGAHQAYMQTLGLLFEGNKMDSPLSGMLGANLKWRGEEGIFRYNYFGTGTYRMMDMVDNQDSSNYVTFEQYLANGQAWSAGDTAGIPAITAYQEMLQKDFAYGNLFFGENNSGLSIHYGMDHDGGMADRQGILYYYSNTLNGMELLFENGIAGSAAYSYYQPRFDARNNILWPLFTGQMAFNVFEPIILTATTNLMQTGAFSITTPITGGQYDADNANGWQNGCSNTCPWPLTNPLNTHLYNLTSGNYLSTATLPYDATTFIPTVGSAAIGAGTALTGVLSTMPVRYNYSVSTSALTPRLYPLDIGSEDHSGASSGGTVLGNVTVSVGTIQ